MDRAAQTEARGRRSGTGSDVFMPARGVVGVLGGSGGAGASSFAAALAALACEATGTPSRRRRTTTSSTATPFLIDLDPSGGGVDVALGAEGVSGARWSGLHAGGGRLDPEQLLDGLPRWRGTPFLACDGHVAPTAGAVRSVITSGREIGPVILDLGRASSPARTAALQLLPALVIVVAAEIRAVTAAAAVRATVADEGFTGVIQLVVRTDGAVISSGRIAEVLGLPLAGSVGLDPGLRSARDRGIDPRRFRRSTRAVARAVIDWAAAVPERPTLPPPVEPRVKESVPMPRIRPVADDIAAAGAAA